MKFKILFIIVNTAFIISCGSATKERIAGLPTDPQVLSQLDQKLLESEKLLEKNDFNTSETKFRSYIDEWNYTVYILRAKIGLARSLYGQGRPSLAIPIFNEVIESSSGRYPEITALSSYYLSFCYAMLGDDSKTLAALKDAEELSDKLSMTLALAEIPSRLAAYYNHKNEETLSREYFRKAEKGITQIYAKDDAFSQKEKARTYFLMGQLNSSQVDNDSFDRLIDSLSITQIFLLRSIESKNQNWSDLATTELIKNYSELWNSILSFYQQNQFDESAARIQLNERRVSSINKVLKNIELLKPFHNPIHENKNTKKLFLFLNNLSENGQQVIFSLAETIPLTEEAKSRQSLKKEVKIQSTPIFEIEKKNSSKVKTDPNLE